MSAVTTPEQPLGLRRKVTQRVTIVGALVNLTLAIVKISVGYWSRSQSLIADGFHSLSDLASDILIWWVAGHAAEGPDEEHPYGHGRFETAATLGLGAALVLVAGGITLDAIERLFETERLWKPSVWAMYVALGSVLANEALYWYTLAAAKRVRSEMLKANAWHHRTDAISSIVVLIGVGGTLLGYDRLDAIAAIIVGLMVAKVGWDLGWGAMQELVDSALEEETIEQIRRIIEDVHGVRSVHMLRTRRQGHEALADVHIQVEPWVSVSEGHMVSTAVELRIKKGVDEITDVTVHVDPEDDEEAPTCAGLPLRDEALRELRAAWSGVECFAEHKRVLLHYLAGRIDVEVFFPLSCFKSTADADALRDELVRTLNPLEHYRRVSVYFG